MNSRNTHSFETVFVLSIFCLFAVCSLFLVLIGANTYRGIVEKIDSNNETRASLSYVANKVHAADSGETSLQTIDGRQVLVITSNFSSSDYRTYIYEYEGSIMELFTSAQNSFTPGDGDRITKISEFKMTQTGKRLNLSATGENRRTLTLSLFLS